jgi:hypothetical protein
MVLYQVRLEVRVPLGRRLERDFPLLALAELALMPEERCEGARDLAACG